MSKWAEGRIFSGREARSQQMIDSIGGRDEAIAAIKILLKTDQDLPLLRTPRSLLEELMGGMNSGGMSFAGITESHPAQRNLLQSPVLYLYPGGPGFALEFTRALGLSPAPARR